MAWRHILAVGVVAVVPPSLAASAEPAKSAPMVLAQSTQSGTSRRPQEKQADPLAASDQTKNGKLDLAEAKSAAAAHFNEISSNQDALDKKHAAATLKGKAFQAADRNHDGKIDKAEYLALVEQRYKAAVGGSDRGFDRKAMQTAQGKALQRLLR